MSAYQGLRFLTAHVRELSPDLVLATYGFNDFSPSPITDIDRINVAKPTGFDRLLQLAGKGINSSARPSANPINTRLSPGQFVDSLVALHTVCRENNTPIMYIIWPTKTELDLPKSARHAYNILIDGTARTVQSLSIDLYEGFKQCPDPPVLLDVVHATPSGCRIAAEIVATQIKIQLPDWFGRK